MADTLITRLSNLQEIAVRPMSAVRKYTALEQDAIAAGQEQRVDAVLDGTIQKVDDRIRITVRLLSIRDGRTLWADKFDEKFTNILAVQDAIAERAAGALALKLTGEEKQRLAKRDTENSEAYQLYIRGRYFWNKRTPEGTKKAIEYFQQAIDLDPNYALAYVGLADSYAITDDPQSGYYAKEKAAAMKALELDDTLAEAHTSMAMLKAYEEDDWSGAEKEFKRGIELNPNYATAHQWYANYFVSTGRYDEALAEIKRAHELDPLSLVINANLGNILSRTGKLDEAMEQLKKTVEMDPNYTKVHIPIGDIYVAKKMYEEALAEYQKVVPSLEMSAALGYFYAVWGKRDKALKICDRYKQLPPNDRLEYLQLAEIYSALGEKDQAFEWLGKACQGQAGKCSEIATLLKADPKLDNLRSDPRFEELVRRVSLPQS